MSIVMRFPAAKFRVTSRPAAGVLAIVALAAAAGSAQGGMLTAAYETQLETWLGQGDMEFTNIYTKRLGDTSIDFHNSVDGRGATFILAQVLSDFQQIPAPEVLGGYNPTSWSSTGEYVITEFDPQRTAFLFNLSDGVVQRQLLGDGLFGPGQYQTFNDAAYGPTFGGGHDLHVDSFLNGGHIYPYSYESYDTNVMASPGASYPVQFGAIEAYTFVRAPAPAAVPEPSSLALWGSFFAAAAGRFGWRCRRRAS